MQYPITVLRGSRDQTVISRGHHTSAMFGKGKHRSAEFWKRMFQVLQEHNFVGECASSERGLAFRKFHVVCCANTLRSCCAPWADVLWLTVDRRWKEVHKRQYARAASASSGSACCLDAAST
jgi:superfamily II DNA helicase RecQ